MIRADLHIHTYYSDGGQSPADVICAAQKRGVGLIAVTDHDNAVAAEEAAALAKKAGIGYADGIEVSAYEGSVKVHMLCYGMDRFAPAYAAFIKKLFDGAEERTLDVLNKLAAVGVRIEYGEALRERKSKKAPVHAMYIARAGARKGYASSPYDFYAKYLNYGKAGFSCACRPTPEETALVCAECGGLCSLAHPGRLTLDEGETVELIERLVPLGLGGIEAVYSGHTYGQTQYYKGLAERYSLYVTGGSDTHCAGGNREVGAPYFCPSEGLLSALKIR